MRKVITAGQSKRVHAIGPFEVTEYLGLVMVWVALALTAPFGGRSGARA